MAGGCCYSSHDSNGNHGSLDAEGNCVMEKSPVVLKVKHIDMVEMVVVVVCGLLRMKQRSILGI